MTAPVVKLRRPRRGVIGDCLRVFQRGLVRYGFIEGRRFSAHQHEFVDMMIEHLTARGVMDPRLPYELPFTDLDPLGVAGVFGEGEAVQIIDILRDVQSRAAA